ncbi:MAG: uracil-DNA glycosylase [Culicoidibacterales bacterium]
MIGNDWDAILAAEYEMPYFKELSLFLQKAYEKTAVFPPVDQLYEAFKLAPYKAVRVVIIGQDPYHGVGLAHGLSFSVKDPMAKMPPSLRNIFKELEADLGVIRCDMNLTDWAQQGVLLLNAVLSVELGKPKSHQKIGWEQFTDAVIARLNEQSGGIIFVLWGNDAKLKGVNITNKQHQIISSAHPSPLAARYGFSGSRPFSQVNECLLEWGQLPIKW